MTDNQIMYKPPVTDLWLLVDEEQTMHYGMRHAWRWLEAEQPAPRRPVSQTAVAPGSNAPAQVCCQHLPVACAA